MRAHGIIGQIMIFHIGRPVLFSRLDWQGYTPDNIALITREVQSLVLNSLQLADPDDEGAAHGR